jgi:hypothetical protein
MTNQVSKISKQPAPTAMRDWKLTKKPTWWSDEGKTATVSQTEADTVF